MKKFFTKSLLLILLAFGGIHAAYANYTGADSYTGYFQFQKTKLSLDQHWVSWTFPNYDYDGVDDALIHSRWYVGGEKSGYDTYITNPGTYFFTPFWQGAEILYMSRTYGITQRQNEAYGVGNVFNERKDGDIRLHDIKFYPGELMGPDKMKYFFVRWTGYWDIDDNDNNKGYWMGQAQSSIGNSVDGAYWQGPGVKHRGNGIARYVQVTYDIPATMPLHSPARQVVRSKRQSRVMTMAAGMSIMDSVTVPMLMAMATIPMLMVMFRFQVVRQHIRSVAHSMRHRTIQSTIISSTSVRRTSVDRNHLMVTDKLRQKR